MNNILAQTLVTGADGMVGSYVDFGIKTNRQSLDVTNREQALDVVRKYQPKAILHLAAATDMERCEKDPDYGDINVSGTRIMALAAKEVGAKLVCISTNAVFDGKKDGPYLEDGQPNPQNVYGKSKYEGELVVRDLLEDYLIIRTSWVFGGGPERDKKFVGKIIRQLQNPETKEIKAIGDRRGTPTFAKDLVSAVKEFLNQDKRGVAHVANAGPCSRYDMVIEMAKFFNSKTRVIPVNSDYFGSSANQLANESLSSVFYETRSWQDALGEYLRTEWANAIE